jgi:hypothetical protein
MTTTIEHSDMELWGRVVAPDNPDMTPEAAKAVLRLRIPEGDRNRIDELATKSNEGTLTTGEREEYERYVRVSLMLSLIHSKARRSLSEHRCRL